MKTTFLHVPLLLLIVAWPLAGFASQSADQFSPRIVSTSPYEVARQINRARKRAAELDLLWKSLSVDEKGFEGCGGFCRARIFRHELDGRPGAEVVVMTTGPFELSRYLIFTPAGKQWKLLGYIDHDFNKYEMSRHRVEHTGKNAWLVIRGQEGSGSGFALYGETWYQVSPLGVKPVLSYPSDGHTYPGSLGVSREFKVKRIGPGAKTITLSYTVTYTASMFDQRATSKRFINTHRLDYKWDKPTDEFVIDTQKSEVSAGEIAAIANIQSEEEDDSAKKIGRTSFYSEAKSFAGHGYEVFLKNNVTVLMKIATGRNKGAKDWLRHFLSECDDMPEKRILVEALK
ncbi:MAG TPA: hypothetical protein VN643_19780 [Pyrinomonadaceae bacterium]|nr:hypothetical protein [Pyrinomonadaceae bacterium]